MEENRSLRDQLALRKESRGASHNEVDPPSPLMNDSSQKLPDWVSDNLRPLVYERDLEDKVMELDKSFARENILEALQELIPQKGVAKHLGDAEVVPLSQIIPLEGPSRTAPAIPAIESSFMSYAILTLFLLVVIWIVEKKIWDSWSDKPKEKSNTPSYQNYFLSSPGIFKVGLYDQRPEVRR